MMALWMMYAVLVSAILAAGAAILDRAAGTATRHRRWIWMLALVLSAGLPAWSALAPRLGFSAAGSPVERGHEGALAIARPPMAKSAAAIADLVARAESRSLGSVTAVLGFVWGAAVVLAVGAYGAASWSLARRRRSWRRSEIDGEPVFIAPATGPAVIGALRPSIVVPEWSLGLTAEQRALMLEHERQHVGARDPLLLQGAALIATLMPWNPAGWWLVRRLRLAVELDCDARVLASGHDARAYGNLLLDVCARRLGRGPMLSPALFERSSSLTRRIVAMYPKRRPFARTRGALGALTALAIAAFACDMPSPEVVAPDGTNQATKRLYGVVEEKVKGPTDERAIVLKYFPSVARGEDGPSILFLVKSDKGDIVLTESQAWSESEPHRDVGNELAAPTVEGKLELHQKELSVEGKQPAGGPTILTMHEVRLTSRPKTIAFAKMRSGSPLTVPGGVGALDANDIATIDVSKHAAGTVAPQPVSFITIVLKPGAKIPTRAER
jgi:beta-lactamase regulating signal transducer with metallopeptidase domain